MKTIKSTALYMAVLGMLIGTGCTKENLPGKLSTPTAASGFIQYLIPKGAHYATANPYKAVACTEMKFTVRFDSSCIYQTTLPENQWDINKLYGFSDNDAHHHLFSARFGWRWSEGALRLYAYVYNNGERITRELAPVPIGKEMNCAIRISGGAYFFSVGEKTDTLPRQSTTPAAKGYQLYPYFGGDETAPHEVRIWIKQDHGK